MMATLLEQMQRDAVDTSVPVSTLLRRAKLSAVKLELDQVEGWLERELSGYGADEKVPDWRVVSGIPRAYNAYSGWLPIQGDPKWIQTISRCPVGQSIPALENLVRGRSDGNYFYAYSAEKLNIIKLTGDWTNAGVAIDRSALETIIDAVRNQILDWAIKLEQAGVKGTDFSFSTEDKQKAEQSAFSVHTVSIQNFTGNFGSGNISDAITSSVVNAENVRSLINQVRAESDNLVAAGVSREALNQQIALIESEIGKSTPNPSLVTTLLKELHTLIVSTAGSAMSSGLIGMLNQALGLGIPTAG